MTKRAEQWTAEELAALVEERRVWLAALVLEVARALDWTVQDEDHLLDGEPGPEIAAAFAALQHLADTGRLRETA